MTTVIVAVVSDVTPGGRSRVTLEVMSPVAPATEMAFVLALPFRRASASAWPRTETVEGFTSIPVM